MPLYLVGGLFVALKKLLLASMKESIEVKSSLPI